MPRWLSPWLAAACSATLVLACGATGPTGAPSATPAAFVEDIAVDGDRTLHIVCTGPVDAARPTIVFENGGGVPFGTWSGLTAELSSTHRACAYDRAGIGMSDDAPEPRTTRDQVDDLATLLEKAGVTGPLVMVVHSAGGRNAIVYTAVHPDQVVGVVLIDIAPPGLDNRFLEELGPAKPDEPDVVTGFRDELTTFLADPSRNPENLRFADSDAEALAAPGFGDRPTEILWAANTDVTSWPGFDPGMAARLNAAFEDARAEVEAKADDPRVTRVDTGHFIHEERPEVVLEAIRRVLDEAAS